MVGRMKNMVKNLMNPEQNKRLKLWQGRLEDALRVYDKERQHMDLKEGYYDGMREVRKNPNSKKAPSKVASNVRNIVYELIESQVSGDIPAPKVTPIHPEDIEIAKRIEAALRNEFSKIKYKEMNDMQERVTPVQGGDFFHVEWDATAGTHCTIGDVSVSTLHPKQVIPQPCVTDINKMDYIFVIVTQTKDFIKRKYGVDVEDATEERPDIRGDRDTAYNDNVVSQNIAYFRNKEGGIGMFSWVDDFVLVDMNNYQERKLERCKKCGAVRDGDKCPTCGGTKFEEKPEEFEELADDIYRSDGSIINHIREFADVGMIGEDGQPILDELGNQIMEKQAVYEKIPYYKPDVFPIIIRKNISKKNKFLGGSDVDVIMDQQDTIKKLGTKIDEKLLRGWSFATMPEGKDILVSKNEMNIIPIKPNEASLIGVYNMQPDVSKDRVVLEENYQWAKSSLGVTDSYQGKYDPSATSGTSKQYSINQAAGRLESKRVMKNNAYASLFKMIFQFWLAYADQPIPLSMQKDDGTFDFAHFNRYDFLKKDDAGEWYWNDEFIFETDITSAIMTNREAMWSAADVKYQSGAFGPIGEIDSLILYWTFLSKSHYPNAGEVLSNLQRRKKEENKMKKVLEEQAAGGVSDEMFPV